LASPAVGHWGTCPLDLQQFIYFSVYYTTSDSDYMTTAASCKHTVETSVPTWHQILATPL